VLEVRDSWRGKSEVGGEKEGSWVFWVLDEILTVGVKGVRVTGVFRTS